VVQLLPARLLVSASPNQPVNSVFLSQQTSTGQPKPAQKPTSKQASLREQKEFASTTCVAFALGLHAMLVFSL